MIEMKKVIATCMTFVYLCAIDPTPVYAQDPAPVAAPLRPLPALEPGKDSFMRSSAIINAEAGGTIMAGSAEIYIPAGALEKNTEISITRLPATESTGEDLTNVTDGGGGWRFEPAGTHFKKAVTIILPYDASLNSNRVALDNLYTYFYDVKTKKWERLERVGIDTERTRIQSQTTHFTDMINATVTLPEGPNPLSFNINSIKNLEAANPGTGIGTIEGLQADSLGGGNFRIRLDIPQGRAGMSPQVALSYSTTGGGLCGKGFDIQSGSSITIDTRWGLPKYTGADSYMLDGVLLRKTSSWSNRDIFTPLRETSYAKIERVNETAGGEATCYWQVTEKNGRVKIYGRTAKSWTGRAASKKFAWYLESDTDVWGNTIAYSYNNESNYAYPSRIQYGPYSILFNYPTANRNDIRVDERGGFVSEATKLLEGISIQCNGAEIRNYDFQYHINELGTSLLTEFAQRSGTADLFRYKFDYQTIEKDASGPLVFFGDQENWALPVGIQVKQGVSTGAEGSIVAGTGFGYPSFDVRVTGGGRFATSGGESQSKQTFVDINSDGLPDSVRKVSGGLMVALNNGSGFGPERSWNGSVPSLEKEEQKQTSVGWNVYGGVGLKKLPVEAGASYASTSQDGSADGMTGFTDMDGDGRVDIVQAGNVQYFRNTGNGFEPTTVMSVGSLSDSSIWLSDTKKTEYDQSFYQQVPFKSWKAPWAGTITVTQNIKAKNKSMSMSADGIIARTYQGSRTSASVELHINDGAKEQKDENRIFTIAEGESLYFIGDAGMDTRNDDIDWNVTIAYTQIQRFSDIDPKYDFYPPSSATSLTGLPSALYAQDPDQPSQVVYKLKDNWEQQINENATDSDGNPIVYSLIPGGYALPGRLSPAAFNILYTKINSLGSNLRETYYGCLFSYYQYDTSRNEYRRNTRCLNETLRQFGSWCKEIMLACSPAERAAIMQYEWPGAAKSYALGAAGDKFLRQTSSKQPLARQPGATGCYEQNGARLILDVINGETWSIDVATCKVYRDGVDTGIVGSILTGTEADKITQYANVTVPFKNGKAAPYRKIYSFEQFDRIAATLTADELARIQGSMQGNSYTSVGPLWQNIDYATLCLVYAVCSPEQQASFRNGYTAIPPTPDPNVPNPPPVTDDQCKFQIRTDLTADELAAYNAALAIYARSVFMTTTYPYYEASGSGYALKAGWKTNITEEALAACDQPMRDSYNLLIQKTADLGLGNWNSLMRSIDQCANGLYDVSDNKITYMSLNSNAFVPVSLALPTWDSARDFSSVNYVVGAYTYSYTEYDSQDDKDNNVNPQKVNRPIGTAEVLYGGHKQWFYGVWCGNQAKNAFSENFLLRSFIASNLVTVADAKAETDSAQAKANKIIDWAPGQDEPTHDANGTVGLLNITQNVASEDEPRVGVEGESATTLNDPVLIGQRSTVVKKTIQETNTGDLRTIDETKVYCPFIQGDCIHPNRAGGSAYYEIEGIFEPVSSGGYSSMAMPKYRRSENSGTDKVKAGNVGLSHTTFSEITDAMGNVTEEIKKNVSVGVSASNGTNTGDSVTYQAVQDINGDGIADVVQRNRGTNSLKVTPGSPDGFGASYYLSGTENLGSFTSSSTVQGGSINASGSASVDYSSGGRPVGTKVSGNGGGGVTFSTGTSVQKAGLTDINGDGLPDFVSGSLVSLNDGNGFVQYSFGGASLALNKGTMRSVGGSLSAGNGNFLGECTKTSFSLGLGVSYCVSETKTGSMLLDINGDGLPDQVTKDNDTGYMTVQFNTGNAFGLPVSVLCKNWVVSSDDEDNLKNHCDGSLMTSALEALPIVGVAIGKSGVLDAVSKGNVINPFGSADLMNVLEFTSTATLGLSGNVSPNVNIPIIVDILGHTINIDVGCSGGVNASTNVTGVSVRMMDVNGDGLPDHVLRIPTDRGGLIVKLNKTGQVGLLKTIHLPQGGQRDLEFSRSGNTPDMPQNRYVLTKVTTTDNNGPSGATNVPFGVHTYVTSYAYAGGYYDRVTKEFFGFDTVTVTNPDGSYGVTGYYNKDYYSKGMTKSARTYPGKYDSAISESYYTPDVAPYARVIEETTTRHDDHSWGKELTTRVSYGYDGYGNVSDITDAGNVNDDTDDLYAHIEYQNGGIVYLHANPESIIVKNEAGTTIRKRTATYNGTTGALESLSQYTDGSACITTTVDWDDYGNLKTLQGPHGDRIDYEYDSLYHQFVQKITHRGNAGSPYVSSMEWDAKFGVKTAETDENGNSIHYAYDKFGRLETVRSPYDTGTTASVTHEYHTAPGTRWYAVTRNKLLFDPLDPNVMETVVEIDGLGRLWRTAKRGETTIDDNGTKLPGWNASGAVEYDAKGRTVAEGQTVFIRGDLAALLADNATALMRPTTKIYDTLDRVVSAKLFDGTEQTMEYGLEETGPWTETTDPLGNVTRQTTDARGNISAVIRMDKARVVKTRASYEYNPLGELVEAKDFNGNPITVEYDLLGRKTALESKDAGRKEYGYNAYGLLEKETDNVLRGRGEAITYEYDDLNRLTRINYPRSEDTVYSYGAPGANGNRVGRIAKVTDESGSVEYAYGKLGEITAEKRTIKRLTVNTPPETSIMGYVSDYLGRMQSITYPDGETVTYGYDQGGQIKSVTGVRRGDAAPSCTYGQDGLILSITGDLSGTAFNYVTDIAYDEFGQRKYIEYGNGVKTRYTYNPDRHWLTNIVTAYDMNGYRKEYQHIDYSINAIGNVEGYENSVDTYKTEQTYVYDDLYQLTSAHGDTTYKPTGSVDYVSSYDQTFGFDDIGNMTKKLSSSSVTPKTSIGIDLNYALDTFVYYPGYAHRLERAGTRYYDYDGNGNLIAEREGGHAKVTAKTANVYNDGSIYSTDYGFGLAVNEDDATDTAYQRTYEWNERNLLKASKDLSYTVSYRYGADGQRALKYTASSETMYFNSMWMVRTDPTNKLRQSKNIYVGETRIATKSNYPGDNLGYEEKNVYWYHSDHLGSAQLVTNYKGKEHERIEYTPYGELWVEKTGNGVEKLPFRFTGKEFDEETGLYYYGARYLDPRASRWLSTDPALGEYIPGAPVSEEARKANGNLPGMGGVFNTVNLALYHYAGNNPVKYLDPDGRLTQHTDLTGKDREIAEAKDIIGGTFKVGLSGGFKVRELGIFKLSVDIDLGSLESTQDQNGRKSEDTAAFSLKLGIASFGDISLGVEKKAPAVDSDEFFDHVKNVYQNGVIKKSPDASINVKGPASIKANDKNDLKLEGGAQFGVGGSLWLNITEALDYLKYKLTPRGEN